MKGLNLSALALLRLLLLASVVAPVVLLVALGWFTYRAALGDARREAVWTSGVAREHAARVFDAQELVTERVLDLLGGLDDPTIRARQAALHDRLGAVIADLPQVLSIAVTDRDGRVMVASAVYPVPTDIDMADRDYFQALRGLGQPSFVSAVQTSRIDGRRFFGLARARRDAAGNFAGVINVAISPSLFTDFYATLIKDDARRQSGRVLTMVRFDGQVLVRYPPAEDAPPAVVRPNAFEAALAANPEAGLYRNRSSIDPRTPERVYAYRKVQDYPLYVVAGRSLAAVVRAWARRMLLYIAAIVPASVVMVLVTLETIRLARREREALAQAQDEIHRREIAEEALRRAQRLEAVGQLTGGIAHDFNNLLTIIVGNVDMMVRRAGDPDRVRRLGGNVLLAARRVADVTDKLLAFSRRRVVRPETICASQLLGDLKPLLGRAVSQNIEIDYRPAATPCPVRVDAGQLEAALINLVVNARDAMPDGGRIGLSTECVRLSRQDLGDAPDLPPGDYVRIVVADTGTGMDATTLAKAFEPFFTTKDVGKGTGLGLSQVYGFAKQAGGHVRIHSGLGRGTSIEILLPPSSEPLGEERSKSEAPLPRSAERGEVVLVVEDEASLRDMAVESLQDLGYRTLSAATAAQALVFLRERIPIDLVFSDIVMPGGMGGIELLEEARKLRPGLAVLLTSGYTDTEGGRAIPDDVPLLRKPYLRADLAAEIGRLLVQVAPREQPTARVAGSRQG
ncbi:MAG TPA: ATP-binding protein [Lichenihabitans sp.]|nr:ATP-binding protein [Lichenihabitans sp.]